MLRYHRDLGHSLVYSRETDTYHMEFRFGQEPSGGQKGGGKSGERPARGEAESGVTG